MEISRQIEEYEHKYVCKLPVSLTKTKPYFVSYRDIAKCITNVNEFIRNFMHLLKFFLTFNIYCSHIKFSKYYSLSDSTIILDITEYYKITKHDRYIRTYIGGLLNILEHLNIDLRPFHQINNLHDINKIFNLDIVELELQCVGNIKDLLLPTKYGQYQFRSYQDIPLYLNKDCSKTESVDECSLF